MLNTQNKSEYQQNNQSTIDENAEPIVDNSNVNQNCQSRTIGIADEDSIYDITQKISRAIDNVMSKAQTDDLKKLLIDNYNKLKNRLLIKKAPIFNRLLLVCCNLIIKSVINKRVINVKNEPDTILSEVIKLNNPTLVRLLLKYGANPNQKINGQTCLFMTIQSGNLEICKLLLEHGASPNQKINGQTYLFMAIQSGNLEICKLLLEHGANPNQKINGQTYLFRAIQSGNLQVCKLLLEHGANPNQKINGHTYLAGAIESKNLEVCKLLLDYGANPNQKNNDKTLNQQIYDIQNETQRIALQTEIDKPIKDRIDEIIAEKDDGCKKLQALLRLKIINCSMVVNCTGESLLRTVLETSWQRSNEKGYEPSPIIFETAELLIAKGANPNEKNSNGDTILHGFIRYVKNVYSQAAAITLDIKELMRNLEETADDDNKQNLVIEKRQKYDEFSQVMRRDFFDNFAHFFSENDVFDLNIKDTQGYTPIHLLIEKSNVENLEIQEQAASVVPCSQVLNLVNRGADLFASAFDHSTPLNKIKMMDWEVMAKQEVISEEQFVLAQRWKKDCSRHKFLYCFLQALCIIILSTFAVAMVMDKKIQLFTTLIANPEILMTVLSLVSSTIFIGSCVMVAAHCYRYSTRYVEAHRKIAILEEEIVALGERESTEEPVKLPKTHSYFLSQGITLIFAIINIAAIMSLSINHSIAAGYTYIQATAISSAAVSCVTALCLIYCLIYNVFQVNNGGHAKNINQKIESTNNIGVKKHENQNSDNQTERTPGGGVYPGQFVSVQLTEEDPIELHSLSYRPSSTININQFDDRPQNNLASPLIASLSSSLAQGLTMAV